MTNMGRMSKHGIDRDEYEGRRTWYAARGQDLPQAKLLEMDVIAIRSAARQRANLLKHIKDNLSNQALSDMHGVSVRCVERVLAGETWGHLP